MPADWDSFRPLSKEVYAPKGHVTKLSKAVLAKLRKRGVRTVYYHTEPIETDSCAACNLIRTRAIDELWHFSYYNLQRCVDSPMRRPIDASMRRLVDVLARQCIGTLTRQWCWLT